MIESRFIISQLNYIKEAKGNLLTIANAFQGNPFRTSGDMYKTNYYFNMEQGEMIVVRDLGRLEAWKCKINRPCFHLEDSRSWYKLDNRITFESPEEAIELVRNLPFFIELDLNNLNNIKKTSNF